MTRILVLSDTHLKYGVQTSGETSGFLKDLAGYFKAADLILHAGDHTGVEFYLALQQMGSLISVCGNMDALMLRNDLPERVTVEREGVRIGMTHGWGPPTGLDERVHDAWLREHPDVIIFGHSHRPHLSRRGEVLLFNPGSPTGPRQPYPTAGWLEIEEGKVKASIIRLPKHGMFP